MKKALLSVDLAAKRRTWYAEEDGKTFVWTQQNADYLVEEVKRLREIPRDREMGWKPVGVMPETAMEEAMREGWFHDPKAVRKWLAEHPDLKV